MRPNLPVIKSHGSVNSNVADVLAVSQPEEQEQTCLDVGENLNVSGAANVASELEGKENSEEAASNEITHDLRCSIQRDFEFLKDCASHVDREVLYNLLLSQMHNSKRLKTIMCDMLHIPNAESLIDEFLNGMGPVREFDGAQSQKSKEYVDQIKEIFPDADGHFLARECDGLENEGDFLRFVNTVMLSGSYVKERTEELKKLQDDRNSDDDAQNFHKPNVIYSSDEEFGYEKPCGRVVGKTEDHDEQEPGRSVDGKTKDQDEQKSGIARKSYVDKVISLDEFLKSWSLIYNSSGDHDLVDNSEEEPDASGGPVGSHQDGTLPLLAQDENVNIVLAEKEDPESRNSTGAISRDRGSRTTDRMVDNTEVIDADSEDELDQPGQEDWINEKTAELMRLFPNNDPTFLRAECAKFEGSLDAMNEFVISKLEKNDMPSIAEYEKRREMEELQDQYTKNFSIEDFLKVIPQPWEYFNNSNRNCKKYKAHSLAFLGRTFTRISMAAIREVFFRNKRNLYRTYKDLSKVKVIRQQPLRLSTYKEKGPSTINIQFLQEVAFIQNEQKIKSFMEAREVERMRKLEEARKAGSLLECQCCFDSEVMVDDAVYCPKDHCFCKNCLVKLVEIEMGQAHYQFTCLAGCGEKYTLSSLQQALSPEVFSKVLRAIQMEEIKAAGIEDLVQCPFCNYATIMPPDVKIVVCLNPECQKESCRLCQELSHVPLRCDEVEKSEEVKMRTYIENKMTEALIRRCYQCGKAFVKEEGCNKMQCSCGAKMCYVCRKPVNDYSHFNGQGGTEYEKCPLYSTNDELHVDLVEKVAEQAKAEILRANPDKTLKHDPTMVLPERTYDDPMPGMNRGAGLVAGLLDIRPRQGIDRLDPVRQPEHHYAAGRRAPATNRPPPHLQRGNHRADLLARQAALFRPYHN